MAVTKVSPASSYQVRYNDGNRIDCSGGAVFARWRGLGILSLAQLGDEHRMYAQLIDPVFLILMRVPETDREPFCKFPKLYMRP